MSQKVKTTKKWKIWTIYYLVSVVCKSSACVGPEGAQFYPVKVVHFVQRNHCLVYP